MKRGDVLQVSWPYSDLSGSKVRPAVVVQADFLNGLIDDTLLVQITSSRDYEAWRTTKYGWLHRSGAKPGNNAARPGTSRSWKKYCNGKGERAETSATVAR